MVDLWGNRQLPKPITIEMLIPHKEKLQRITEKYGITRTPFDKNFRIKQLYLSRLPQGFVEILLDLSGAEVSFVQGK